MIFAQKQSLKQDVVSSFESDEIVLRIKKLIDLTSNQEEKIYKHLRNKKEFFSTTELSVSRKETVLNAYKEDFDNIISAKQIALIKKKNNDLYTYITTSY